MFMIKKNSLELGVFSCQDGLQIWNSEASTSVSGRWLPILAIPDAELFQTALFLPEKIPRPTSAKYLSARPHLTTIIGLEIFLQSKHIWYVFLFSVLLTPAPLLI